MNTQVVTLQLPITTYNKLEMLATKEEINPVEMISQLIIAAYKHREWLQSLNALRQQIQQDGGLTVGDTEEEVVMQLRKTRQEIFEAEYAHLYR